MCWFVMQHAQGCLHHGGSGGGCSLTLLLYGSARGQSAVPCCSAEQATPSYRPRPHYCHMCDSSLTSPISEPHSRGFALCETTTLQFVAYIGQQLTIPATAIYSNRSVEFRLSILTLLLGLRTPTFMALRFQPAPVALYGLRRL